MPKTIEEKINQGREYRRIDIGDIELRDGEEEKFIVVGYATKFNNTYRLFGCGNYEVYERVDQNAFDGCDMSDTIMQYDHEGRVFARISNNTLNLSTDEVGLKIRAYLGGTEGGRQLFEEIKGGYITKMSFGFVVDKDERKTEEKDDKTTVTRTIKSIRKLYDVSAVSIPANDATEISARSFGEDVIEEARKEFEKAEADRIERERRIAKIRILCEVHK